MPAGTEAAFLAPHRIDVLPDVPPDIRERLDVYQLERIGMVAAMVAAPSAAGCRYHPAGGAAVRFADPIRKLVGTWPLIPT